MFPFLFVKCENKLDAKNYTRQQFVVLGLWSRQTHKSLHSLIREQGLKEKLIKVSRKFLTVVIVWRLGGTALKSGKIQDQL